MLFLSLTKWEIYNVRAWLEKRATKAKSNHIEISILPVAAIKFFNLVENGNTIKLMKPTGIHTWPSTCPPASRPWTIIASAHASIAFLASSKLPTSNSKQFIVHEIHQKKITGKSRIHLLILHINSVNEYFPFNYIYEFQQTDFGWNIKVAATLTWGTIFTPAQWASCTSSFEHLPHEICRTATFSFNIAFIFSSWGNSRTTPTPNGLSVNALVFPINSLKWSGDSCSEKCLRKSKKVLEN